MNFTMTERAVEKRFPNFDLWDRRVRKLGSHGYTITINIQVPDADLIYSTYNPTWLEYYKSNVFVLRDPVFHWGLLGEGAIRWSEINLGELVNSPYTNRVFEMAREYGMNYGGVATARSTYGYKGRCYLSVARNDRELTDVELQELSDLLAEAIAGYRDTRGMGSTEIEVVQLLADGHTQEEIAQILGLSRAGVRKRIERARIAMNATNSLHMIAIAVERRLVRVSG